MAAKWEFEENKNIPNSRSLLQKGLRVNPSSQKLWLEVISYKTQVHDCTIMYVQIYVGEYSITCTCDVKVGCEVRHLFLKQVLNSIIETQLYSHVEHF